jgi:membrane protein
VLISLSVVTLIIALLMLSFAATSIVPLLKALSPFLPGLKFGKITQIIIRFVLPFVLVLFVVMTLYILIPKTRVNFFHSLRGAMFTTIFLEIAKHIFTWSVGSVAELGKVYGPLTAIISFLFGVLFISILIGAEIVHNSERLKSWSRKS